MPYLKIHRESKNEMYSVLHCKCSTAGWHFWRDICADTAQTSQNQQKAQGCTHCRQTMNHHFKLWLQGPWKLLCFILQFPFFFPPFLQICSIKWALISISSAPESNRKATPCASLLCFTAILIYIKIRFMSEHQNMVLEVCSQRACPELPRHWPAAPPPQAEKATHSSLALLLWLIVV